MALVTTNVHIEYDTTGRFYYLTELGATDLTGYSFHWNDLTSRLKKQGRALKRWLTTTPNNQSYLPQYRPIDLFEYMVFMNENDEVNYIIEMLVEMVEWAYHTDGDLAIYEDGGSERVPATVKDIAQTQGLRMIGNASVFIEDDEYRVGY